MMAKEKSQGNDKKKKGRDTFSASEIETLRELIIRKCNADSAQQKSIRNKMRNKGFYITDFRDDITSVEEFDTLLTNGEIKISGSSYNIPKYEVDKMKPTTLNTMSQPASVDAKFSADESGMKKGLPPVVGDNPKVLILGTLPGDESIRLQQYYSQKGNRFWKIVYSLLGDGKTIPTGYDEKIQFLKDKGIALWDVLHKAKREGSLDSNIQDEVPNDLMSFLKNHPTIKLVAFNGKPPRKEFDKYFSGIVTEANFKLVTLPSTSGSNCQCSISELLANWQIIKKI